MIHRKNLLAGLCTISMLWLGGCANWNSIYRTPDLASDKSKSVITDAKQRLVFSKPRLAADSEGDIKGNIICAEPSPDVAQALSSAISLAFEKAGAEGKRLGANAAFSFGDSIAQLGERLAIIQLLRDKMYRACEAYANGAVDKVAYTLMLARLDKTMVTLLSQEMAAGAFGRSLAKLGGTVSADGIDPQKRAILEDEIKKLTLKLEKIATSSDADFKKNFGEDKTREALASETADELKDKHAELLTLEFAAVRSAASSGMGSSAPGTITRPAGLGTLLTSELESIHRAYLDDPGLEPLFDACLTAMTDIKLSTEQADEIELARISQTEEIAKIEMIARFDNTIVFLEELLTEEPESRAEVDLEMARRLGVTDPKNNKAIRDVIESLRDSAQKAREEVQTAIRKAEIEIDNVFLRAGNPFASFCLTQVFGEQFDSGFISTMVEAQKELRKLDQFYDKDLQIRRLAVCQKMLEGTLTEQQRTTAIAFCTKTPD